MICGVLNAVVRVANCIVANTLSPSLQLPLFSCTASFAVEVLLVAYVLYASRKFILGGGRRRLTVPVPAEASTSWTTTKVVDELKLQDPKDPRVIKLYDPCSGYVLGKGTARAMDAADVKAVVAKARAAQPAWAASSFETRRELLRLLMDYIVEHQEEICRVASRDTGKTMVDGAFGEVLTTCEKLRWTVENGEKALAPEHRGVGALAMHKSARVEYHPMGVLGAIIPWNYPFHNMYGQLISALFAGNAIVIKVSEHATWSAEYYLSIVHAALKAVGHSPDLVQIVTGYAEAGNALINSGVDKVTFIGSPGVGKLVMKAAADTLTPVVLELGGKDAAVICEDCDYDQVVNLTLRGTFQNCGQNCIGLERLVVHEKIYDRFVQFMEREVNKLTQGAPMNNCFDCGAMTMGVAQVAKIQHLVDDAVKKGARLLAGGKVNTKVGGPGTFYTPTLLADVTPAMEIAQEEVFGPVMVIMKSKDDQDSIRLVNSSQYGLGSSVFSKDYARAERIARAIRAGMSNINDFGVNYLCQSLPFGGVNISGFDRFAGIEGLRGCCLLKAVTSDKTFIRTTIPPPLQYPIMASGFKFCEAMINMFYGDGLAARAKGLFNLARISLSKKK